MLAGVLTGIVSMVRFLLAAMKSLERLEAQHEKDAKERAKKRAAVDSAVTEKTENDT